MKESILINQVKRLEEPHFLILLWCSRANYLKKDYNITNVFDDLKRHNLTRTKQNAVSYIEGLHLLSYIDILSKSNKKNLLVTNLGLEVLSSLVKEDKFSIEKKSIYLEE